MKNFFKAVSVLTFVLCLTTFASASHIINVNLSDNFGREWNVIVDLNTGRMTGNRDINDDLGCGPAPIIGYYDTNGTYIMTSMDDPVDTCITVVWEGVWAGNSGTGNWTNENMSTGTYTITLAKSLAGSVETDAVDPSGR